jgi:hypothetical protein
VVPNGSLPDGEPTCLIFVGKGFEDVKVYKLAYAFEQISKKRYSTPLAPALPEESFSYVVKKGPPVLTGDGPIVTITGKPDIVGTNVVITGKIISSVSLAYLSVFVNGKRVPASFTAAANQKNWTASFPASAVEAVIGTTETVSITVEAVDTNGHTEILVKKVKFDLGE